MVSSWKLCVFCGKKSAQNLAKFVARLSLEKVTKGVFKITKSNKEIIKLVQKTH